MVRLAFAAFGYSFLKIGLDHRLVHLLLQWWLVNRYCRPVFFLDEFHLHVWLNSIKFYKSVRNDGLLGLFGFLEDWFQWSGIGCLFGALLGWVIVFVADMVFYRFKGWDGRRLTIAKLVGSMWLTMRRFRHAQREARADAGILKRLFPLFRCLDANRLSLNSSLFLVFNIFIGILWTRLEPIVQIEGLGVVRGLISCVRFSIFLLVVDRPVKLRTNLILLRHVWKQVACVLVVGCFWNVDQLCFWLFVEWVEIFFQLCSVAGLLSPVLGLSGFLKTKLLFSVTQKLCVKPCMLLIIRLVFWLWIHLVVWYWWLYEKRVVWRNF